MPGKLHLGLSPHHPDKPICGRQLNNHRDGRAQVSDRVVFAPSREQFTQALLDNKGCLHCGYVSGILVRTVTVPDPDPGSYLDDDESGDD